MKNWDKNRLAVNVIAIFFFLLTLACWFLPKKAFSDSERRELAKLPEISPSNIADGGFMTGFETYSADHFPFRDDMRTLKALFNRYIFRRADSSGIYITDGYAVKTVYPLDPDSVNYAAKRFRYVYDRYLENSGCNVYFAVIPDNGYYLAEKNGYLTLDYGELVKLLKEKTAGFALHIDLTSSLDETCYYRTDTHWRQEKLRDAAYTLLTRMGNKAPERGYKTNTLDYPFRGVYCGQSALPLKPDTLCYLTWEGMEDCTVINGETGKAMPFYDMEKAAGKDPYMMFLGGSLSLLTIENPHAAENKHLIIFRDSFGSSIAPLLTESYGKVTLADIRYLNPEYLGGFVDFENADVLFLYSTLILNESSAIK